MLLLVWTNLTLFHCDGEDSVRTRGMLIHVCSTNGSWRMGDREGGREGGREGERREVLNSFIMLVYHSLTVLSSHYHQFLHVFYSLYHKGAQVLHVHTDVRPFPHVQLGSCVPSQQVSYFLIIYLKI